MAVFFDLTDENDLPLLDELGLIITAGDPPVVTLIPGGGTIFKVPATGFQFRVPILSLTRGIK